MIKADKLNYSYQQNKKILKNINFAITRKQFVGLIGPNGCGKSTLLKNISNILKPESGTVYLNKKLLNEYNSKDLAQKMAVVPQETYINFNFTVYDLIMMGRNPYQDRWGKVKKRDKKIIREAMNLTDTYHFKDKMVNTLSGGEKQRVIIARALAQKPRILLLDEPTASLDINYQGEIYDLLSYLNKELDLTILSVSHDLNLTSQYCDRIILMNKGKIYISGTPEEVMKVENINEVYQTEVIIKQNPITDRPYVTLVPDKYKYKNKKNNNNQEIKIHVVCGGGSGKEILEKLYVEGYKLSSGVINQGDSDWEKAKELDLKTIEIPPFAYINEDSARRNFKLMKESDIVIIADTPFGYGNIENLNLVNKLKDKKIILIKKEDISERDYTDGKAVVYWNSILEKSDSYIVFSIDEMINKIQELEA
ncbi:MAG: ABC transporter ATP-binding protein [Halanaerobiaceae bacterium]